MVEIVLDAAHHQLAVGVGVLRVEQPPQLVGLERSRTVRLPRHHHIDVLPIALVIVPAVVVGVEEPVLNHELVPHHALETRAHGVDKRVSIDPLEPLIRAGEPPRQGVFVLALPARRVVAGKVEVEHTEGLALRVRHPARQHVVRGGARVERLEQPEQPAIVVRTGATRRRGRLRRFDDCRKRAPRWTEAREIQVLTPHPCRRTPRHVPRVHREWKRRRPINELPEVHRDVARVRHQDRREPQGEREQPAAAPVVYPVHGIRVPVRWVAPVAVKVERRARRRLSHDAGCTQRHESQVFVPRDALARECRRRHRCREGGAHRERHPPPGNPPHNA